MGKPLTAKHKANIAKARRKYFKEHPEGREKISEGRQKAERERLLAFDTEAVTHKVCSGCGDLKELAEFGSRRQKLKCGLVKVYPEPTCRACDRARFRAWMETQRAEGIDINAAQRERWAKRSAERKRRDRERNRENAAIRRRKEGAAVRGPYKRLKDPKKLPIEPISGVLTALLEQHPKREISQRSGLDERQLYRIEHQESQVISVDEIDALLIAFDLHDEFNSLYPTAGIPERLVGYGVLDPENDHSEA